MGERSEMPLASLGEQATRSQAVTSLAVVSFILGVLELLGYSCMFLLGLLFRAIHGGMQGQSPKDEVMNYSYMGISGMMVLSGLLKIVTGTGMLRRKRWARNVMLILGGLEFLPGLGFIVSSIVLIGHFTRKEEAIVAAVLSGTAVLIHWSYCGMVFAILLRKRIANEFS